jgi:ABC-type transport system involved in multi-copper enzyme maturation permease subunit
MPGEPLVAKAAAKIQAIAVVALQETLRRKVLYIVAVLVVLAVVFVGSGMVMLRMATQAGETETAESITTGFVQVVLGMWSFGGLFLGIFLGAVGISSEVSARTIVNVFSRPVERATYLTGRWLGIVLFLGAFQFLGILIALVIAQIFDVRFTPTLWLGFVEMFVNVLFMSGVSLSLSVIMPPVPAGICTVLLSMLPGMVESLTQHPRWILRLPASVAYYLAPAQMPVSLVADSFAKQLLDPDYMLYAEVLAENLAYAIVVFVLACVVFSRSELRLR